MTQTVFKNNSTGWKILYTILALFPIINIFFIWDGSKKIDLTKDINNVLRVLFVIFATIIFIIGIIIAIWDIWSEV